MRAFEFTDTTCSAESIRPDHFHLAIIYDNANNAFRAMDVCNHLISEFSREFLFHLALCDFKSFDGRHNDSPAMKSARRARLVLVAASEPLPDRLCEWLEAWALDPTIQPLAVGLLLQEQEAAD